LDHHRGHPECPQHGEGGTAAQDTAEWRAAKAGFSTGTRRRQLFTCRYVLKDGTTGSHKFQEPIMRLAQPGAKCPHCGSALEEWRGERVFKHYWYLAEPIADILVSTAAGLSYRKSAERLHIDTDSTARRNDPRHLRVVAEAEALKRSGDSRKEREGIWMLRKRPYRLFSNEPHLAQWVVEACAEIVHKALAPQAWPEHGIIAVDSVKLNLTGAHKYMDQDGNGVKPSDYPYEEDEDGIPIAPEGLFHLATAPVAHANADLDEMLDPDDEEEAAALAEAEAVGELPQLTVIRGEPLKRTRGGVPNFQVLGAYGYERNGLGEFPRDEHSGKPWLFRAYHTPDGPTWAHFLRQLPGTPDYVICDGAPEIKIGVELAWPDPATRPKIILCEYHVVEALKRRVAGHPNLETLAERIFQLYGREVKGKYEPHSSTGLVGSLKRLYHLMRFRLRARAEGFDFDRYLATPTWRRIMAQIREKDWSLRYSTGALEATLWDLANRKLAYRRMTLTNRERTDRLLMLCHLEMVGCARADLLIDAIHDYLKENHPHSLPRQKRLVEAIGSNGKKTRTAVPSLRRPLTDAELAEPRELREGEVKADVGLPAHAEYAEWRKRRQNRMAQEARNDRYHRSREFRARQNQRRAERRRRDPLASEKRRAFYEANREHEIAAAKAAKARAKALDPEGYKERDRVWDRHSRSIDKVVRWLGWDRAAARDALAAFEWDEEWLFEAYADQVLPGTHGRGKRKTLDFSGPAVEPLAVTTTTGEGNPWQATW
jgi:hypothetical protein